MGHLLSRGLYWIQGGGRAVAILIAISGILIVIDVFMRYILSMPLVWRQDVCLAMMMVFGYVAVGYAEQEDTHVRIQLVTNLLPPRRRRILLIFTDSLGAVICGIFAYGGVLLTQRAAETGELSWMGVLPIAPIKACFILGFLWWGLVLIVKAYKLIASPAGKGKVD